MYNYKGIFYKEEKEKKYYEGGAHFSYSELVFELNKLIKEKNKDADMNSSRDSKETIFLASNYQDLFRETQKTKNLTNIQKKMKLNFLTINNNNIQRKKILNINKDSKLILNTEKNNENRQNSQKMILASKNMKISPLKTNPNNNKKMNSIEKNYNIKTLENKANNRNIYKNITLYINNKEKKNNNLPIITNFHYNNFSNKNIFKSRQNNLFNLKFDSKVETSKYNLFLKNKILSPLKNIQSNRENKLFSVDFSESKYNKNTIDTITSNKNRFYLSKGKLTKYIKDEIYKQKNKLNINIINLIKNKKL
jgi:hypothetical protein